MLRVHWNLPLASLLYSSTNPSPSHTSALILSHLLPQKMNSTGSKRFISNLLCTRVTSPSMDFRISVYPHAMYIFSAMLISPDMLPQCKRHCFNGMLGYPFRNFYGCLRQMNDHCRYQPRCRCFDLKLLKRYFG